MPFNLCKSTSIFERIIANIPPASHIYCSFYKRAVEQEASLAKLNHSDNLMFIGGGAVPYSALILSKMVEHVTVIDSDELSAQTAKRLVERLGIKNVTVMYNEGASIDPSKHSVVFIPLQAEPKKQILLNLKEKCLENTKILMRIPKQTFQCIYTPLESLNLRKYKTKSIKQLTYDKVILFSPGDIGYEK